MAKYRQYTNEDLKEVIKNSTNWSQVVRSLKLKQGGGTKQNLKRIAQKLSYDFSHFCQNKGFNKGHWIKGNIPPNKKPIGELLKNGVNIQSNILKKRVIAEGLLKNKCMICGQPPIWNNQKLVLELHHVDGDKLNNRLSNLKIICPHCHSQTPNFRGKNKRIKKLKRYCKLCNVEVTKSKTGLCRSCNNKTRDYSNAKRKVKNRPPVEQLIEEIKELGYVGTGKKYGVSDVSIRNWIKIKK
ncbi:MAG: HNH endonuclease [Candidatus Scalindua sp.]|jgi:hypothetical protein|nr:HNH endonuclease [Candidatus Scalindua sp.]